MLLTSIYGLMVVTTFISEVQLEIKLHNHLYQDKYIIKPRSKKDQVKDNFKTLGQLLIPIYNVVSSVYNFNNFDKYYEKKKNKMIKQNYLDKVEIKPIEDSEVVTEEPVSEKQPVIIENLTNEKVQELSIQDEIQMLEEEKVKWTGDEESTEFVLRKTFRRTR